MTGEEGSMPGGRIVTTMLDYDGGREVSAYVPSRPAEAILYGGDGELLASWGADLERSDLPPTMIIGVHRAPEEMARLEEYSPGFDPERFAAHERLLTEDVPRWVAAEIGPVPPPERTAMLGLSAGGELALALGMRHPHRYAAILCASPGGGYRPPASGERWPDPIPRTYLVAGDQEPFFRENAERWRAALEEAGADVVMTEQTGDHGDPFWREELPRMVAWAFGGARLPA